MAFYVKQQVQILAEVKNEVGELVSPGTFSFKVKAPNKAAETIAGVELSKGLFRCYYVWEEHGIHSLRFEGVAGVITAAEREVEVEPSAFYA